MYIHNDKLTVFASCYRENDIVLCVGSKSFSMQAAISDEALDHQQTLSDFLLSLYDGLDRIKDAMSEIGIRKLTATQLACLSELPLPNFYHCLKVFAGWMEEGMYDFSTLPYTIKAHMSKEDMSTLRDIPHNWDGMADTAQAHTHLCIVTPLIHTYMYIDIHIHTMYM